MGRVEFFKIGKRDVTFIREMRVLRMTRLSARIYIGFNANIKNGKEHSVEEVLERPTGYPKVGGSNHGSGDFSLQPQRNPFLS